MIEFECPACGKKVRARDGASGRPGKCRKCGAPVRVPGRPLDPQLFDDLPVAQRADRTPAPSDPPPAPHHYSGGGAPASSAPYAASESAPRRRRRGAYREFEPSLPMGKALLISLFSMIGVVVELVFFCLLMSLAEFAKSPMFSTILGGILSGVVLLTLTTIVLAPLASLAEMMFRLGNVSAIVLQGGLWLVGVGYGLVVLIFILTLNQMPEAERQQFGADALNRAWSQAAARRADSDASRTNDAGAASPASAEPLQVWLTRKHPPDPTDRFVRFDIQVRTPGLTKNARKIEGVMYLEDRAGDVKTQKEIALERQFTPGGQFMLMNSAFYCDPARDDHRWVRDNNVTRMRAHFKVTSIQYSDGTTERFPAP